MFPLVCNVDRLSFLRNGVPRRLPLGFRFEPTDEELIVHYLKKKVMSCPLPAYFMPEVDACKSDPWDLPGDSEEERYFFSTNEAKYPHGIRPNRTTDSGYWRTFGMDKKIVLSKGNEVVGMKKTLVFYEGKPRQGTKTDWIMHEYRLAETIKVMENLEGAAAAKKDNWVLCRIFMKKKSGTEDDDDGSPASSSSSSDPSELTSEIPFTPEPDDDEQTSSSSISTLHPFNPKP